MVSILAQSGDWALPIHHLGKIVDAYVSILAQSGDWALQYNYNCLIHL